MAVVGVARRIKGYPIGDWGEQQKFTDCFQVQTDSYADGPIVVLQFAVGLPKLGQPYATGNESHPWALCRRYPRVERLSPNSLIWVVECEFETLARQESTAGGSGETAPPNGESQAENPLLEIPEIEMDYIVEKEIVKRIYGDDNLPLDPSQIGNYQYGFTSSAGELLDPQPLQDVSRQVLKISRNELLSTNHAAIALQYQDVTNEDTFWDALPGQVKLYGGIKVKRMTKMTPIGVQIAYLRCTYEFHFRYPSWDIEPLDNGTYYKPSLASAKRIAFKTTDGQPYRGLLDGAGNKLAEGAAPHYLGPYRGYRRVPFGALLLPNSFLS